LASRRLEDTIFWPWPHPWYKGLGLVNFKAKAETNVQSTAAALRQLYIYVWRPPVNWGRLEVLSVSSVQAFSDFVFCKMDSTIKPLRVVAFAFKLFKVVPETKKWQACCKQCNVTIVERRGTTSGFVK